VLLIIIGKWQPVLVGALLVVWVSKKGDYAEDFVHNIRFHKNCFKCKTCSKGLWKTKFAITGYADISCTGCFPNSKLFIDIGGEVDEEMVFKTVSDDIALLEDLKQMEAIAMSKLAEDLQDEGALLEQLIEDQIYKELELEEKQKK